jgi:CubicO group peptidase (beta-lactamase class C family)
MNVIPLRSLSLILSLVFTSSACADMRITKASKVGFSAERLKRIQPVMQQYVEQKKLAGTLTLVARKGKVVHLHATGSRDIAANLPMSEDTLFRIYSMSKPVTAVAALTLWEQGRFHMDEPISKYLPELKDLKVYVSGEGEDAVFEKAKTPIKIIDLFLHTAGFSYGFTQSEVDKRYQQSPMFSGQVKRKDLLSEVAKLPLAHQPGTAWNYGISTDIIGFLVEKLSGQTLGEYMAQHIFEPLNMDDTGFYVPANKLERLMQVYTLNQQGQTIPMQNVPLGDFTSEPEFQSGGGGLVSTMKDYFTFAQMLLNEGEYDSKRILSRKTVEYMRSNHLPASMIPFSPTSPGEGYALAMTVTVDPGQSNFMGSKGVYGWAGLASTYFRIDPKEKMILISMTQFMPSSYYRYHHDFHNLVYQALEE